MNYDEIKSKFLGDLGTEILEALPCGLFVASHTAGIEGIRIIYMNQVFLDCIGYHREEFEATGRDMGAVVMPQDNIAARQQLHDALKSKGKIILQDYRIHRPNGECNHVLCGMKNIEKVGNSHFLVATYMKLDEFATKEKAIVEQRYKMEELTSRLSRMIQNLPSGCAVVQGADRLELISGNAEFFRPLGYTLEEIQLLPGDLKDIVYPSDVQQLKKAAEEVLRNKESKECEIRIVDKMGRTRWLSIKIRYYYQQHGIPYFLIACWDIHERKLVEEELYLQTERYQLMEEMNNEIPFEYDVKKRALLIPKKFDFMLSEEFNNQDYNLSRENIEHFFHPEDEMEFWKTIDRASLVPEEGSMEYRINIARREKNPEYAWFSTSYKSVLGVSGKIVRILGRTADISKEKTERNEMAERLRKDPLTGILNKVATKTTVEEFLTSEPVGIHALFLIDIDNFKEINDTFGHLFGDSALVTITEKIKVLFRSNDVVGRIGGDEFVAFMKHTSPQQVRIKAQAICDAVKQEYNGAKEQMEISCSVGVALYDQKKDSYVTLFSKADRAMYQAKIAGKNQYCLGESAEPLWHVQKKSNIESRGGRYKAGE
ncbi:MAG: diguanylate cyclase, partial [Lachnospiraceae bacterium]